MPPSLNMLGLISGLWDLSLCTFYSRGMSIWLCDQSEALDKRDEWSQSLLAFSSSSPELLDYPWDSPHFCQPKGGRNWNYHRQFPLSLHLNQWLISMYFPPKRASWLEIWVGDALGPQDAFWRDLVTVWGGRGIEDSLQLFPLVTATFLYS